jgi:hypothetical protein
VEAVFHPGVFFDRVGTRRPAAVAVNQTESFIFDVRI